MRLTNPIAFIISTGRRLVNTLQLKPVLLEGQETLVVLLARHWDVGSMCARGTVTLPCKPTNLHPRCVRQACREWRGHRQDSMRHEKSALSAFHNFGQESNWLALPL